MVIHCISYMTIEGIIIIIMKDIMYMKYTHKFSLLKAYTQKLCIRVLCCLIQTASYQLDQNKYLLLYILYIL